ncbi:hypothetical protein GQ53DRAFT_715242 [Thozetella sp. PMI_491]|nr:hypothetical protein GQ53DRAFT_715242 [Thozetella sp. PMI_491]
MSPLHGFSDNPFRTRSDVLGAVAALLRPLGSYRSPAHARVRLPTATVAGFDDVAARLEGYARPLWAIAPIILVDGPDSIHGLDLRAWIKGLAAGTDPTHPEFWGNLGSFDQRMVEMESIAVALLAAPHLVLSGLGEAELANLRAWLLQINDHDMPKNNWRWFRVFTNIALVRFLGVSAGQVQSRVDSDLAMLDTFELGEGWSSDGVWDANDRQQADYYSGSFAIQFAQLLYIRFAEPGDKRAEKYRLQAVEFATKYWRYFDVNGAAIPFGRSLTYRFAMAAFWAALAVADVQLPTPLGHPGVIKGLLLRHLRWWASHPDIFNIDGTLNIGFTYPNMYLCEEYNSPQSVYWCLKSLIVLYLKEDDLFWTCEEQPHPLMANSSEDWSRVEVIGPPGHIACSTLEHHYLLSSGQMSGKPFKAREAKYGKFAYSSAFGFSVPTGPHLQQIAPDSTLCASIDGGETWVVRWKPTDVRIEPFEIADGPSLSQTVPSQVSMWRPWTHLDVCIETRLVPTAKNYPGWHLRLHKVKWSGLQATAPWVDRLTLVDGGFAISSETATGFIIPKVDPDVTSTEGWFSVEKRCLIRSEAGASGICDLTASPAPPSSACCTAEISMLQADPNTNLIAQRTAIPISRYSITVKPDSEAATKEVCLATAVFAVSANSGISSERILEMWRKQPLVKD